jgi:nicotinamide mononucleotide adenylyltransferase
VEDSKSLTEIGLFSGRFDPPTAGHFVAIQTLCLKYAQILVVILDYKGRDVPAAKAKQLFDYHFELMLPPIARNKVITLINKEHFGMVTVRQIDAFLKRSNARFDTYISGNVEVLRHMEKLGYKCRYLPRVAFPLDYSVYSATNVRKAMKAYDMSMEDFYNLEKSDKKARL